MKKLSFLELEKEMDLLSEEEASKAKGGGSPNEPPRADCFFQGFAHALNHLGVEPPVGDHWNAHTINVAYDQYYNTTKPDDEGVYIGNAENFSNMVMDNLGGASTVLDSFSGAKSHINNNESVLVDFLGMNKDDHHVVVLNKVNDDGTVDFYDPTYDTHYTNIPQSYLSSDFMEALSPPSTTYTPSTTIASTTIPAS